MTNEKSYPMDTACSEGNILTLVLGCFFWWFINEILSRIFGLKPEIFTTESLKNKDNIIIKDYFRKKIKQTIRGLNINFKNIKSKNDLKMAIKSQKNDIKERKQNIKNNNENNININNNDNIGVIVHTPQNTPNLAINTDIINDDKRRSRNLYRDGSQWNDKSLHSLKREMLEKIIVLQMQELTKANPNYNVMNDLKYANDNNMDTPTGYITDTETKLEVINDDNIVSPSGYITDDNKYDENMDNITPIIKPANSNNISKKNMTPLTMNTQRGNEFITDKRQVHFSSDVVGNERTTKKPTVRRLNDIISNNISSTNNSTNNSNTNSEYSTTVSTTATYNKPTINLHQIMSRRLDKNNKFRIKVSPAPWYLKSFFAVIIFLFGLFSLIFDPEWWYDHYIIMDPSSVYYTWLQHASAVLVCFYIWDGIMLSQYGTFQTATYIHHWFSVFAGLIVIMGRYNPHAVWYATFGIGFAGLVPFTIGIRIQYSKRYPHFTRKLCIFTKYFYGISTFINITGQIFLVINGQIRGVMPPFLAMIMVLGIFGWLNDDRNLIHALNEYSTQNYQDLQW